MRLALFEPDIPGNAGAILRLGACLGIAVDIIEPAGFVMDDKRLRRAGMDYLNTAAMTRHASWEAFADTAAAAGSRLLLLTTKGDTVYTDFAFEAGDVLLLGRESAGAPDHVHARAYARLRIPIAEGTRSLNVATAAAMVAGEALRQTGGFAASSGQVAGQAAGQADGRADGRADGQEGSGP